jgi:hypothetical protein
MDWIKKEDDQGFCLEAKFLTHRGARQELQRASFVRAPDDTGRVRSYIRYWPGGYHAVARIRPRTGLGRITASISYYDSNGTKFHRSPLEGTLSTGKDHRLLVPRQSAPASTPLFSSLTAQLARTFTAAGAALRKSKYEVWLEHQ